MARSRTFLLVAPFLFTASILLGASIFLNASPAWSQTPGKSEPSSAEAKAPPVTPQRSGPGELSPQGAPPTAISGESTDDTSSGTAAEVNYDQRRRDALSKYKVGDVDPALSELKNLIALCDRDDRARCPDETRANLYVALGIVLAGGKDDIKGAARLFHAALSRDPEVTVPRDLATRPVQEAMREANESTNYQEQSGAPDAREKSGPEESHADPDDEPPASYDDDDDDDDDDKHSEDRKTLVVLLHGLLGTGADDFSEAPSFGAAGILGARFVDSSAWTTAIRGRVAVVGIDQEPVGGAALLMGGTWYREKHNRMGYFLGGLGLDSYGGEGGVSVSGMGGVTLGGFLLGGGVDLGASNYGSFAMVCLHLGWGARL